MNYFRIILYIFITVSLTNCISYDLSRSVIQQGTLLPQDKVAKLKIGMSKQDVLQLLGSSLTHDLFNRNRLDYAYTYQRNNRAIIIKYVALTFKKGKLVNIQHYPRKSSSKRSEPV